MGWQFPLTGSATRLRAPTDGIVSTRRERGWLGQRWMTVLRGLTKEHQNRLARGRTFARSGRIRDLWFSPGLANAEVHASEVAHVSVRVRVLDDHEWKDVVDTLLENLRFIAALLEGDLPRSLVDALDEKGLALLPGADDLDGDCDCADYVLPCAHMAGVHALLADALDGDPFLLLTLRGRTREQLLAELRRAWGDTEPLVSMASETEQLPPDDTDWESSRTALPPMTFRIEAPGVEPSGLHALGPPPGNADLIHALGPLYESGARAAFDAAMHDSVADVPEQSLPALPADRRNRPATPEEPMADPTMSGEPLSETDYSLTEKLVDALADRESAKSKELAEALAVGLLDVRSELLELEKLGIVYRTGQTRGTRWWLG